MVIKLCTIISILGSLIVCYFIKVEFGFNPTQYRVNEQERQVTFEIENRNPDRSGEYSVQFTTVPGSAVESTNGGKQHYNGSTNT